MHEQVVSGYCLHLIDHMGNNCVNIADTALKKVNLQYFTALEA